MELTLNKITTEKWEVSTCSCGCEPKLEEWSAAGNPEKRYVAIQCPQCRRRSNVESYFRKNQTADFMNARYQAIIMAITSWENLSLPKIPEEVSEYCRKCKAIDHCIDHAINHPHDAIRCSCYGLLKLCIERSKENGD